MPTRKAYEAAKAAGRCPDCGAAVCGYVFCVACRSRMQRAQAGGHYAAALRARFAAEGRCSDCGTVKPDVRGKVPRCNACRAALAALRRATRNARRARGACVECGQEEATGPYLGLGPHCSARHARSLAKRRTG